MVHDMTKGAILPMIIHFTIPLVLGNLLQLTYNAADSIIVGRLIGEEALAAVGTSNPIMTLAILFVQGICLGAGILIGTEYGAKEYGRLKRQVSTAMLAGLAFSLCVGILGIVFAVEILKLLQVKEEILNISAIYLRIIFCGLVFSFIYNFFASTLRAMGDSRSPLYFLGISAVINIIGDIIFVACLDLGIVGCAVSTVLSEGLSCLLCWLYIKKNVSVLNMGKRWLVFDTKMLGLTVRYGIVSALQQSTVQIGKLGIQAIVNSMGVSATAAFTAVNRVDDYAIVPEQNIGHAMTSVMAQNRGAGIERRVKQSFKDGMLIEIVYGVLAGIILLVFTKPIMEVFTESAEVCAIGEKYLRLIAFMYIVPAVTNGIQGYFRGIGDLKITLISSMVNFGARAASCALLVFGFKMGFQALPWSYLTGWAAMLLYEMPYLLYRLVKRDREI